MRARTFAMACCVIGSITMVTVTPTDAADLATKIGKETAARPAAEGFDWTLQDIDFYKRDRSFFVFAALGGEYGTAPAGWLAVNPWTGDVWNVWAVYEAVHQHFAEVAGRHPPELPARRTATIHSALCIEAGLLRAVSAVR